MVCHHELRRESLFPPLPSLSAQRPELPKEKKYYTWCADTPSTLVPMGILHTGAIIGKLVPTL